MAQEITNATILIFVSSILLITAGYFAYDTAIRYDMDASDFAPASSLLQANQTYTDMNSTYNSMRAAFSGDIGAAIDVVSGAVWGVFSIPDRIHSMTSTVLGLIPGMDAVVADQVSWLLFGLLFCLFLYTIYSAIRGGLPVL